MISYIRGREGRKGARKRERWMESGGGGGAGGERREAVRKEEEGSQKEIPQKRRTQRRKAGKEGGRKETQTMNAYLTYCHSERETKKKKIHICALKKDK